MSEPSRRSVKTPRKALLPSAMAGTSEFLARLGVINKWIAYSLLRQIDVTNSALSHS
jgi:hypothetical protein